MSRVLKLDTPPRTVVCVALPADLARAGKVLAVRRGVPFTRIMHWALRRYVQAAEGHQ